MKRLLIVMMLLATLGGCKSAWRSYEDPMSGLPKELGNKYTTRNGVTVYVADPFLAPTEEEMKIIDEGIFNQLVRSNRDNPDWVPQNEHLNWSKYKSFKDYSVVLVPSGTRGEMPDTEGCQLLNTYAGTAAGTVKGVLFVNGKPETKGDGPWILVPRLDPDAPARCRILLRRGVDHESEHVRLLNSPRLFLQYTGENDWHPIFPLREGDVY